MSAPIRLKDPSLGPRTYTFSFSFGGLAVLLTAFTLALTVFFVLGVVVGRGHRPERALPPVARIMPTETAAPSVNEVLKADELGYSRQLTKKSDSPVPARPIDAGRPAPTAPDNAAVETKAPAAVPVRAAPAKVVPARAVPPKTVSAKAAPMRPASKPVAVRGRAVSAKASALAQRGATQRAAVRANVARKATVSAEPASKGAAKAEKPDPDTRRYDYVYQAASFPDEGGANVFAKKLKARGIKAGVESGEKDGKPWRRVVVYFQGTPTETRGLKARLSGVGVAKPLMRSKIPAE